MINKDLIIAITTSVVSIFVHLSLWTKDVISLKALVSYALDSMAKKIWRRVALNILLNI